MGWGEKETELTRRYAWGRSWPLPLFDWGIIEWHLLARSGPLCFNCGLRVFFGSPAARGKCLGRLRPIPAFRRWPQRCSAAFALLLLVCYAAFSWEQRRQCGTKRPLIEDEWL